MKDDNKTKKQLVDELVELRLQNAALKESESADKYRSLVENIRDVIYELDSQGVVLYVSPAVRDMLENDSAEIIGKNFIEFAHKDDQSSLAEWFSELRKGKEYQTEYRVSNKSGELRWARTHTRPIMEDNLFKGARGILIDVTAQKLAASALRESEGRWRELFTRSRNAISIYEATDEGQDFIIRDCNPAVERIEKVKRDEIVGRRVTEVFPGVEAFGLLAVFRRVWKTAVPESLDVSLYKDKRISGWRENFVYRLHTGEIVAVYDDVTLYKQAEEALRESEEKYRLSFDNVADVIYIIDTNLNVLSVSPSVERILGYKSQDFIGRSASDLAIIFTPESFEQSIADLSLILNGETISTKIYGFIAKDGIIKYGEVTGSPVMRDDKIIGLISVARDITDRKKAEEELQRTIESLRKAVGTTIQVMVSAVEARDPYTAGHQERSANLARTIATEMGLSQDKIEGLRMAGSIHDIGKLSIPAEILSKPTKLSAIELSLIKEHSLKGYEMLKDVESPWPLAEIVYQHHERMDGSGYPRKLKGNDILIEARILIVADVVEAMASHRPYRPSLGIDEALNEIEKNRGTLYDNTVVDACLRLFREKGFQLVVA